MKRLYAAAAAVGALLPLAQLAQFLAAHGPDARAFLAQLFANHVSAFFAADVLASSLALWLFVFSEGRRLRMRNLWLYVACNLAVGVSLALPLFLLQRERRLDAAAADR